MDGRDVPLGWCLTNRSNDSARYDRAENNGCETAVDAQERYNVRFRELHADNPHHLDVQFRS